MRMIFPVGNFVNIDPYEVEVRYDLPYHKAIDFLKTQDPHVHDMRDSYVIDRGKVRGKKPQILPIHIFRTTFPAVSRFQMNHICYETSMRPVTFIELLAFARKFSMMKIHNLNDQTVTAALGSVFQSENRGKEVDVCVSYVEMPPHMMNIGPSKSIGYALLGDGYGEGVFFPLAPRNTQSGQFASIFTSPSGLFFFAYKMFTPVCCCMLLFLYMEKIKVENHTFSGGLWLAAWLFTLGFLDLTIWQGVLAIIIWPYYLGAALSFVVGL